MYVTIILFLNDKKIGQFTACVECVRLEICCVVLLLTCAIVKISIMREFVIVSDF